MGPKMGPFRPLKKDPFWRHIYMFYITDPPKRGSQEGPKMGTPGGPPGGSPPGPARGGKKCTFFWVFNNSPSRDVLNFPGFRDPRFGPPPGPPVLGPIWDPHLDPPGGPPIWTPHLTPPGRGYPRLGQSLTDRFCQRATERRDPRLHSVGGTRLLVTNLPQSKDRQVRARRTVNGVISSAAIASTSNVMSARSTVRLQNAWRLEPNF